MPRRLLMICHSLLAPKRLIAHVATEGGMSWRIAMLLHSFLTTEGSVAFVAHVWFA
jgi:hypothetical protein